MGCCNYNFDEIVDRKHQHSKKWTNWSKFGLKPNDEILPFWIADMDFKCEPRILEALRETVDYGVMGYDAAPVDYYEPFLQWQKKKNQWEVDEDWLIYTPGVVPGIANSILCFTQKSDKILIQTPVYYPFFKAIESNGRTLVQSRLIMGDKQYGIDFEDFEEKIKACKMMILCNPHNPVGRVYTEEELLKIGEICVKHDVLIISDEIHGDLIMKGNKHIPIATLSEKIAQNTITLTAPSKSFNVAGLSQSVAIIPNPELRERFLAGMESFGIMHLPTFGITGFHAAYKYGEDWLNQALEYIEANMDYVLEYLQKNLPQVRAYKPEGTFLMWLDFRAVSEDMNVLNDLLINKAKILMDSGHVFGENGCGFYRFNVGCPRFLVVEAMERLTRALH